MRSRIVLYATLLTVGLLAYARAVSVNTTLSGGVSSSDVITYSSGTVTTLNVSSMAATNVTVSTININTTIRLPQNAAPQTNIIPTAIGQLIINTGATPDELCFSTGTAIQAWVRVRTPSATCSN